MKILNLYAGIGGNRKLWGDNHDITAVELVPEVAKVYQSLFPKDKVIIGDAHEYLRRHFREFDFIWARTRARLCATLYVRKTACLSFSKLWERL